MINGGEKKKSSKALKILRDIAYALIVATIVFIAINVK